MYTANVQVLFQACIARNIHAVRCYNIVVTYRSGRSEIGGKKVAQYQIEQTWISCRWVWGLPAMKNLDFINHKIATFVIAQANQLIINCDYSIKVIDCFSIRVTALLGCLKLLIQILQIQMY